MTPRNQPLYNNLLSLPDELLLPIFAFLSLKDLMLLNRVSNKVNQLVNDGSIWSRLLSQKTQHLFFRPKKELSYKETYKTLCQQEKNLKKFQELAGRLGAPPHPGAAKIIIKFFINLIATWDAATFDDKAKQIALGTLIVCDYMLNFTSINCNFFENAAKLTDVKSFLNIACIPSHEFPSCLQALESHLGPEDNELAITVNNLRYYYQSKTLSIS